MIRIVLRTPDEKRDLERSWGRADKDFFAAGACHVLAAAFLQRYPSAGFRPLLIQPFAGFRGSHVVVATDEVVFDCNGFNAREAFLHLYSASMRAQFPNWSHRLIAIDDPIGWAFCRGHQHRHPSQFFRDPLPRAKAFLKKFPPPRQLLELEEVVPRRDDGVHGDQETL